MLRSLLGQLYHLDEAIRPEIRKSFVEKYGLVGGDQDSVAWQEAELERLFQRAVAEAAQRRPVTVFVDALDQAGARTATELAWYFEKFTDALPPTDPNCRICLSSRHCPIIATSGSSHEIIVEHGTWEGINSFNRNALPIATLLPNESEDAREAWVELRDDLEHRGVYEWVRLVVPEIKRKILEGSSSDEVRLWLYNVPHVLAGKYTRILETTIDPHDCVDAFVLFQWVCLSEGLYFSASDLHSALDAEDKMPSMDGKLSWGFGSDRLSIEACMRRVVSPSGGLLEIASDSFSGPRRPIFIHPTAKSFMLTTGLGLLYKRLPDADKHRLFQGKILSPESESWIPECHASLYRSCLNWFYTESWVGRFSSNGAEYERKCLEELTFLKYIAVHMFVHAEKAGAERTKNVDRELSVLDQVWPKLQQLLWAMARKWSTSQPIVDESLLHTACTANMVDLVQRMLARGDDPNQRGKQDNTPLHYAARKGRTEIVQLLSEHGADWKALSTEGDSPIAAAASTGWVEFIRWAATNPEIPRVVELLLGLGPNPEFQHSKYGNALQAVLAGSGDKRVMKMLLNAGADGNAALRITARNQSTPTLIEAMRECGITVTESAQSKRSSPSAAGDTDTRKRSRGSRSAFYNYGTVGNIEPADNDDGNDHRSHLHGATFNLGCQSPIPGSPGGVTFNVGCQSPGLAAPRGRTINVGSQDLQGRILNVGTQSLTSEERQGATFNVGCGPGRSTRAAAASDDSGTQRGRRPGDGEGDDDGESDGEGIYN
ncbi:hypothetical protein BJX62DRAFT_238308 [Aspergillus germanicus]